MSAKTVFGLAAIRRSVCLCERLSVCVCVCVCVLCMWEGGREGRRERVCVCVCVCVCVLCMRRVCVYVFIIISHKYIIFPSSSNQGSIYNASLDTQSFLKSYNMPNRM